MLRALAAITAAFALTTCSAGGIGGHSVKYTAWAAVTWNFVGGVVSATALSSTPTIDPSVNAMIQAQAAVMSVHAVPSISVWK